MLPLLLFLPSVLSHCVSLTPTQIHCLYLPSSTPHTPFHVPPLYTNLTLRIHGASGGSTLSATNTALPTTRGLGLYLHARLHPPPSTILLLNVGSNGFDASLTAPGLAPSSFLTPGNGGTCPLGIPNKRYGASGGSASSVATLGIPRALLVVAGGGGAGGFNRVAGFSKGGDSPVITGNNETDWGRDGVPGEFGGRGGGHPEMGFGRGGRSFFGGRAQAGDDGKAGDGADGSLPPYDEMVRRVSTTLRPYCLAGGGGGSGFENGGGGGAFGAMRPDEGSAGGGGSGQSILSQTDNVFEILEQRHQYTENPRIEISYNIPYETPERAEEELDTLEELDIETGPASTLRNPTSRKAGGGAFRWPWVSRVQFGETPRNG